MAISGTDPRPARVLRLVANGETHAAAAAGAGVDRKTISRWRADLPGFGEAMAEIKRLRRARGPAVDAELDDIIAEWTPGGLYSGPEPDDPEPITPDVLDGDGREIVLAEDESEHERTDHRRAPVGHTHGEWVTLLYRIASDPTEHPQVRTASIVAGSSAVFGGPAGRKAEEITPPKDKQLPEGRPRGTSSAVWREIKQNLLGPPDDAASSSPPASASADVVEIGAASSG